MWQRINIGWLKKITWFWQQTVTINNFHVARNTPPLYCPKRWYAIHAAANVDILTATAAHSAATPRCLSGSLTTSGMGGKSLSSWPKPQNDDDSAMRERPTHAAHSTIAQFRFSLTRQENFVILYNVLSSRKWQPSSANAVYCSVYWVVLLREASMKWVRFGGANFNYTWK